MNTGQKILLRALGVATSMSVLLILYYNLTPNYVDGKGLLVEEFWALELSTLGLICSLLGLLFLVFWLWVSSRKAKKFSGR
jgi:hypothetical protein